MLIIFFNPLRCRHVFLHLLQKLFLNTDRGLGGALSTTDTSPAVPGAERDNKQDDAVELRR